MKNIMTRMLVVVLVAGLAVFSVPGRANAEGLKVAVIDMGRVMKESKVAASIQDQLETQRAQFQSEFSKLERKLMETEKRLAEEAKQKGREEIEEKNLAFEKELLESRGLVQKRSRSLEKASSEAILAFKRQIDQIVEEIAREGGYTIVLTRQDVIYAESSLDITDKVLMTLDKRVKEIKLNIESE